MSFFGGGHSGSSRSESTSTSIVNGKKVVTRRVVENGVETVTVEENGHVVSRTIDGVPQATDSGCSDASVPAKSSCGGGHHGSSRSESTSTSIVNGKKVVTRRVVDNGVETVTVEENGHVVSKTVDGVPQAVDAKPPITSAPVVPSSGGAFPGSSRSESTSTSIVNGKKVVTRRVVDNGVEIVTVEEDGQIVSMTADGVPQKFN